MKTLGPLQAVHDRNTSPLARAIIKRMAEIDGANVTKSHYRDLGPDEQDEPPTGDDYNLLWDAILDEIEAHRLGALSPLGCISISVEGGLVQSVNSDDTRLHGVEAVVIDYDTGDETAMVMVPHRGSNDAEALVHFETIEPADGIDLAVTYQRAKAFEAEQVRAHYKEG